MKQLECDLSPVIIVLMMINHDEPSNLLNYVLLNVAPVANAFVYWNS